MATKHTTKQMVEQRLVETLDLDAMADLHLRREVVCDAYDRTSFMEDAADLIGTVTAYESTARDYVCSLQEEVDCLLDEERFEHAANIHWFVGVLRRMAGLSPDAT